MWFIKSKKETNKTVDKEKEELRLRIELLKKKISELEYLEFKHKRRESVRKFYEQAKLYCYELLKELQNKKRS